MEPDAVNTDAGKSTFFVSAALSAHSQLTRRILPMLPFYISIFLWIYLSTKLGLPLMTSPNQTPKADPKADSLKTPAHRSPKDARFEEEARDLTRTLPASKKVYVQGSRPDIQVPMREITLTDTPTGGLGKEEGEHNPHFMCMTRLACIPTPMPRLT